MRYFRLVIGGAMLTLLMSGCGGTSEGTTMPTGAVTTPPEMEQMKSDMQKRLLPFSTRFTQKSHHKSASHRS